MDKLNYRYANGENILTMFKKMWGKNYGRIKY
jgi:hypothetical protein